MGQVNAQGRLQYRCSKCAKVQERSCPSLAWRLADSKQRELGTENHFVAAWTDSCDCGSAISFEFRVREYPFNCLDGEDLRVSGAELLRFCNIGIKESVFLAAMKAAQVG